VCGLNFTFLCPALQKSAGNMAVIGHAAATVLC